MKFYGEVEQSNQDRDGRLELMTDRLYRLQSSLQEDMAKRELKCTFRCGSREDPAGSSG